MSEYLLRTARRLKDVNPAEAARLYAEILRQQPAEFEALFGLGSLLYQTLRLDEAERFLAEAVRIDSASAEAQFTRGCVLQELNRPEAALEAFDAALSAKRDFADAIVERAACLRKMKRYDEALAGLDAALSLDAAHFGAWVNRGYLLREMLRPQDALECFDKAAALRPDAPEVLINRGNVLYALKRVAGAAADYEKALAADSNLPYVKGTLAYWRLQACDWRHLERDRAALREGVRRRERVVQPYQFLTLSDSAEAQWQCARIAISNEIPAASVPLWRGERYGHARVRLGYISADYREHAVARLIAGVFECHDKTRFETVGFALSPEDSSAMRARISHAFDRFTEVAATDDPAAARLLREMEIDIAIDLTGFTAGCRPGILAQRPAPLQANFLGYPGTMGASFYDYVLADRIVVPDAHRPFYSEKIVHLPHAYQSNDSKRRIDERTPSRAEAGLPQMGFVFCCFNNNNKIVPEIFDIWMRLLRGVEASILWLLADNPDAERNLKREAETRGVAPERLVFAKRVSQVEHLARHRLADLFLDTLPYGAHTTASDALWVGLPVLTCVGNAFPGRVAASLNTAIGITDTITNSLAEYETLALALAQDPARLAAIKAKLAQNRDTTPLFDTARFTRNLEAAYLEMWERHLRGLPPDHLDIADTGPPAP